MACAGRDLWSVDQILQGTLAHDYDYAVVAARLVVASTCDFGDEAAIVLNAMSIGADRVGKAHSF